MAFLAVTSLMRSLEFQFLHPQPRVTLSNKKQIKSLHEKLGDLLVFLDKFEKNGDNHPEMRAVTERIIAVSVKAEDDIEEELLTDHHHNCLTAMNRLDCCCLDFIRGFSTSVLQLTASFCPTKLEQTLQRVVDEVEKLVQIAMNATELVNSNNLTVGGSSSQHTSHEYTSDLFHSNVGVVHVKDAMVGHSEELVTVRSWLLNGSIKQLQVMAVVGMDGIGKTTFAKTIYDHYIGRYHFDKRGWTTMSQEHNKGQAILDLCRCFMPLSSAFNNEMEEDDLKEHLYKSLLGHRYLIIVDDIWTTDAWDDIHRCFPDNNNGSKILLTTRTKEVAQYVGSGEYSYDMRFLNQDEGWSLFCQQFLEKELLNKYEFERIGKNIVRKCQGLPLTVVVMAGLLSKTNKSIDEWEKIEKNLSSLLALDLHEQFSRIFTLSYNHLPSHLKGCFLSIGVFHGIPVKKLIRLWIAKGFVETMSHRKRLEEVGRDYLQDLIDRNLVMVDERSFDGQIKTCRMHDLLHELCTSKAKNENLLYLETTGSKHSFGCFVRLSDQRSILCFNGCGTEWYLLATSFKKLRVLDLGKIDFKKGVPGDITDLVFLRYLALASSSMLLKHIPLDKNWNLQTLIISGEDDNDAHELLPHGIWNNLQQLRHLEINHKLQVSIDLLKVQKNLQTLYWLSISQCTAEVFMRIPNVKELGIVAGGHKVSRQGLHYLCFLNYLEKLRFQGSYNPLHLPPFYTFPQSLKELTFVSTCIPWKAMSIISMLPNLEVLKLKKFACTGQVWELTEDRCFPELKVLIISRTDLKEWKANVDAPPFPNLERLKLKKCFELEEMPYWFADIYYLKLIKFVHCYASLVRSADLIQQEKFEYGNEMLDVVDFHTRPDHYYEEEDSSE